MHICFKNQKKKLCVAKKNKMALVFKCKWNGTTKDLVCDPTMTQADFLSHIKQLFGLCVQCKIVGLKTQKDPCSSQIKDVYIIPKKQTPYSILVVGSQQVLQEEVVQTNDGDELDEEEDYETTIVAKQNANLQKSIRQCQSVINFFALDKDIENYVRLLCYEGNLQRLRDLKLLSNHILEKHSPDFLLCAIEGGHVNVCEYFVLEKQNGISRQALQLAASHGKATILQFLLCQLPNQLEGQDFSMMTYRLCSLACENGHLRVAKWLYREHKLEPLSSTISALCTNGQYVRTLRWVLTTFPQLSIEIGHAKECIPNNHFHCLDMLCKELMVRFSASYLGIFCTNLLADTAVKIPYECAQTLLSHGASVSYTCVLRAIGEYHDLENPIVMELFLNQFQPDMVQKNNLVDIAVQNKRSQILYLFYVYKFVDPLRYEFLGKDKLQFMKNVVSLVFKNEQECHECARQIQFCNLTPLPLPIIQIVIEFMLGMGGNDGLVHILLHQRTITNYLSIPKLN